MLDRHVNRFVCVGVTGIALLVAEVSALAKAELSGVVTAVSGDVKLVSGSKSAQAKIGLKVQEKDQLQTGPGGMVQVRYSDGNSFTVFEKASVKVSEYRLSQEQRKTLSSSIDVAYGKLRFFVNPKGETKKKVKFRSQTAVMGIRGTSGIISVEPGGLTQLHVISGRVEVFNPKLPNLKVPVGPFTMTRVEPAQAPAPPVPVPESVLKTLVPQVTAGSGFSDDSAQASASYNSLPTPGTGDSAPDNNESGKGDGVGENSENSEQEQDVDRDNIREQERENPSNNQSPNAPQGSSQNSSKGQQRESASRPVKPVRPTRSGVTLFQPGGELVQSNPDSTGALDSLSPTDPDRNRDNESASQSGGTPESQSSGGTVPAAETAIVSRTLESVTTELEQVNAKTERSIEKVTSVESNPTPESRVIQIRVPLPPK